ncbi:hypothetical protein BKI52_42695 [marine bacterium AO1-C]|nr:hypothetical protein BKI52_42695 [marine bacterium AO1-C]
MRYCFSKVLLGSVGVILSIQLSYAQKLIEDKPAQQTALEILNHIYSWEFDQAREKITTLKPTYANHPAYYLLQALVLHWQYMPLEKGHPQYTAYGQLLDRCTQLAEVRLKKDKNELEGVFFKLMPNGLKALAEVESGSLRRAVGYGRKAYSAVKRGFKLKTQFSEFYFSTGLYRYYAKQFPKSRPIIKPFMIFFPAGDKSKGLQNLQMATQKALFTRQEALVFLGDIYLRYESNLYQASLAFGQLLQQFPNNSFFALKYAECLVHLGRYYEAQNYFAKFQKLSSPMYQIGLRVLQGIIAERLQKDDNMAKKLYGEAVNIKGFDQRYSRDFRALAKAGLARIMSRKTNKEARKAAKALFKQARKHTEYEWLKKQIKQAIKGLK